MLELEEKRYKDGQPFLSGFSLCKILTELKKEENYLWLNDVGNSSMQSTCNDLEKAYKNFFKKNTKHPRFKTAKYAKQSYPIRSDTIRFINDNYVMLPKAKKVRYKTDFKTPRGKTQNILNPRVTFCDGIWILSFSLEAEDTFSTNGDFSMGIDLGVKEQAVVAYGDNSLVFHNINKSAKMRRLTKQLEFHQRKVSRKYECVKKATGKYTKTKNIIKEENIIRRILKKMRDIRLNYIHQITHKLVSLLPKRVVMEDLNVKGMMSNRHLAKAIGEQNFYEFIRQMKYKCEWNGIEFIQVDRFYASSKTCCCCGQINRNLKLSDRVYKCECGNVIDRDLNAAINLMRYEA